MEPDSLPAPRPAEAANLDRESGAVLPRRREGGPERASLVVLACTAVGAVLYLAQTVIVVVLVSLLLAIVIEPLVERLSRWRVPRPFGAFFAVALLVVAGYLVSAASLGRAVDFFADLPRLSQPVRAAVGELWRHVASLRRTSESVLPSEEGVLKVRETPSLTELLAESAGDLGELLFALGTIPFLVYFMLTWRRHVRDGTLLLFHPDSRAQARHAMGAMGSMLRRFFVGNVVIGLLLSALTAAVLGALGVPYFYFVGVLSGFLSLVPYLGVVLAVAPPLMLGIGQLDAGGVLLIVGTVLGAHLLALNVLYPKLLGSRVHLNPLVVTVALLAWGSLWGAMGLLLAVPLTGGIKIVCDHVERLRPFGAWLGDRLDVED